MVTTSTISRYGGLVVHANQPFISTIIQGEARKGLPFLWFVEKLFRGNRISRCRCTLQNQHVPFLYKIEFLILPVCNIAISCKFAMTKIQGDWLWHKY